MHVLNSTVACFVRLHVCTVACLHGCMQYSCMFVRLHVCGPKLGFHRRTFWRSTKDFTNVGCTMGFKKVAS